MWWRSGLQDLGHESQTLGLDSLDLSQGRYYLWFHWFTFCTVFFPSITGFEQSLATLELTRVSAPSSIRSRMR